MSYVAVYSTCLQLHFSANVYADQFCLMAFALLQIPALVFDCALSGPL